MALTKSDIKEIKNVIQDVVKTELDDKIGLLSDKVELLSEKVESLDEKVESLSEKVETLVDFADFAKPALEALLEESQANFVNKLPERVKRLEVLHQNGTHIVAN